MIAYGFFTVDTVAMRRIYVLFFIELSSRRVHLAEITENPDGAWVAQQARNFVWGVQEDEPRVRFLIRDNDAKFGGAFDEAFRTEGIQVIRTPVEAPKANAIAERFVGTVRRECLNWLLIANRRHLERVLQTFIESRSTGGTNRHASDAKSRLGGRRGACRARGGRSCRREQSEHGSVAGRAAPGMLVSSSGGPVLGDGIAWKAGLYDGPS